MSTQEEADKKILEIYKAELSPPKKWELGDAKAYRKALRGAKGKGKIARFAPIGAMKFETELKKLVNSSSGERKELFQKQLDVLPPDSFPFLQFTDENPVPNDKELLRRGNLIRNAMNDYDPYSSDNFEPKVAGRGQLISADIIRYNANLVDAPSTPETVTEYLKTPPQHPGPRMQILSSAKDFQNTDYDADDLIFWTDGPLKVEKDNSGNTKRFKENLLNETLLNIHEAIKRHGGDFLLKLKEENEYRIIGIQNEIDRQLREFMKFGTTGNYVNRYTFMEALSTFPKKADNMMYNYVIEDNMYKTFCKVLEIDSKGYRKWKRYVADKMARYLRFMTVHYKGKAETTSGDNRMKAYKDLNKQAEANRKRIEAIRQIRSNMASAPTPSAPPAPLSLEDMRKNIIANISNTAIASKANPLCGTAKNLINYTKRMERWGFDVSVIDDQQKLAALLASFNVNDLIRLYETTAFCAFDQRKIIEKLGRSFPTSEDTDEKRATFTWNFAKGIAPTTSAPPAPITPAASAPPTPVKPLKDRVLGNNRNIPKDSRAKGKRKEGYQKRMTQLGFGSPLTINDFKEFTRAELVELFDNNGMLTADDQLFLLLVITGINKKTLKAYLGSKGGNRQNNRIQMVLDLVSPPPGVLIGDYIVYIEKRGEFYSKFSKNNCVRYLRPNLLYDNRIGVISNINWDDADADIKLYEEVKDKGAPPEFRVKLVFLEPLKPEDCNSEQFKSKIALKAAQKQQLKQQIFDNQDFGILEGQDAVDFIDEKNLTFSTPNAVITKKDWFDVSSDKTQHYGAKLFYDAENGKVKRLVIACIEASDDIDGVKPANVKKTMELIEIQNYAKEAAKKAGTSAESIRPFVQEVLKYKDYNAVDTVYLSPASNDLTEIYKDLWGMEEVNANGNSTWLKANKKDLIKTLGKPTQQLKKEKKARDAAEAAQKLSSEAVELEVKKVNKKNWSKAWLAGDTEKTAKFYIARQADQSNLGNIFENLKNIDSPHVAKYNKLDIKDLGNLVYLFEYGKKDYKFKATRPFKDYLFLTENYGRPLKINKVTQGPEVSVLRKQMVEALDAIHAAKIVHQDVTLDNMMWDEEKQKVTLIDFSDAREKGNECEVNFSGKKINILPPKGLVVDKDKWSLVLALLNYGDKTMYRPEDRKDVGYSALTTILFEAESDTRKETTDCWVLKNKKDQPGFMFHDDGSNLQFRESTILGKINETEKKELFYHLWFIFNKQEDLDKKLLLRGLIPGFSSIGAGMIAGEAPNGKDKHPYISDIVDQMGDNNIGLAKRWVDGHLRWGKIQKVIDTVKDNTLDLVTLDKIKDTDTKEKQFGSVKINDLGDEYYGIPTDEVVKIFEIIKEAAAATSSSSGGNPVSDLAYDSFSDAELDELEIAYEPYDEEELDRLMSEYESEAESEKSLAASYNSESENGSVGYNSESEQSLAYNSESERGSVGYNSESERGSVAYNSESERGSVAYNSESEQSLAGSYNSESEHGSVKYNSESESEKVDYNVGYDSDSD